MRSLTIRVYLILVGYAAALTAIGRHLALYYHVETGERFRWWLETLVHRFTGASL